MPFMIVVPMTVKAATLADFIAQARAKPKSMSYGTGGVGTITHLGHGAFASTAKVELLHVPYKGVGAAVPDLLSGRLQVLLFTVAAGTPHVRAGKVRGLAVTRSTQRSPLVPDLPTVSEAGLPGLPGRGMVGIAGAGALAGAARQSAQQRAERGARIGRFP